MAHEPPTAVFLPDRKAVVPACEQLRATYETDGHGAAMARFIALVMEQGELDEGYADRPGPDPAAFGMPPGDDGSRDDPLFRNMPSSITYAPELLA